MSRDQVSEIIWAGEIDPCFDNPAVRLAGSMVLGTYGGNSSAGAYKNEDGAVLWSDGDADWEFAVIIDGHNTSESVHLLLDNFTYCKSDIIKILNAPLSNALKQLNEYIVKMLSTLDTSTVQGESSCLICARKGSQLWWLNIGDCTTSLACTWVNV